MRLRDFILHSPERGVHAASPCDIPRALGVRFAFWTFKRRERRAPAGFSLIEIIIVVGLLSLITLGLLMMFNQVQRVFRAGLTQVDVLEGGRNVTDMLSRELQQMRAGGLTNEVNFYAWKSNSPPLMQDLPGGVVPPGPLPARRANMLEWLYFLTRENQTWTGIGYRVEDPQSGELAADIGTLYRYESSTNVIQTPHGLFNDFITPPRAHRSRVLDGVVQFKVRAYDANGNWITNEINSAKGNTDISMSSLVPGEVGLYLFRNDAIPAYVELEFGILEDRAYRRVKSIPPGPARDKYLTEQTAGKTHLFRLRVPVRNVDAAAYQ